MLATFAQSLAKEAELIDATLNFRSAFKDAVATCQDLICVEVANFVGLGAVRFKFEFFLA
jgi:hypothetical protein